MASDDLVKRVRERDPACAKVGVFDVDGIFRGKYMAPDKLASALAGGFGFCDVVLGWDSSDQLYDNAAFTGWHTAYPDAEVRLLPETERAMPFEGGMPLILGEFAGAAEADLPARRAAPGARPGGGDGLPGQGRGRVRILRLRGDSAFGPREGLSRAQADHAGPFRLFDASLGRPFGLLPASSGRPARRCGSSSRGCTPRPGPE